MRITYQEFRKNKFFFFKYFSFQMILMIFLTALVLWSMGVHTDFMPKLSWSLLGLFPIAFVFGVQVPVALHNAVHFNIKPRWLNEVIGELCGFFVLFGMGPFRISHVLHHAHSDDEHLDPHPPMGKSFLNFLATTQLNTIRVISNQYFELHGRSASTYSIMVAQMLCYYVGLSLRLFLWFKVLGPTLFVAFYIPAFLANLIVFAHINFATHQTMPDGEVVIVNLNHNLYYKTLNILSSGAYFHKNHHLRPNLYNPSTLALKVKPAEYAPADNRVRVSV